MSIVNTIAKEGFDSSVEIVSFDSVSGEFKDLKSECRTLKDYLMLLSNRKMDIVVYFDSACIKRMNRDVNILPKLCVHQIIVHDYVRKQQSTIGLKFAK